MTNDKPKKIPFVFLSQKLDFIHIQKTEHFTHHNRSQSISHVITGHKAFHTSQKVTKHLTRHNRMAEMAFQTFLLIVKRCQLLPCCVLGILTFCHWILVIEFQNINPLNQKTSPAPQITCSYWDKEHSDFHSVCIYLHPPVDKQISSQPFCANDFEDDLIGLQRFEVDAAGQSRVQALSQSLSDDQPPRQQGVLQIALEGLR